MPTVEGLTPSVLWTTIYGIVALGLLFLIGFRVYDAIHTLIMRRKEKKEEEMPDLAEKVSRKVLEKLEPRLTEIENNLGKDKARLDNHELLISSMSDGQKKTREGLSAIAKFMLAIGTYGEIGTHERVKEASSELQNFLADQLKGGDS